MLTYEYENMFRHNFVAQQVYGWGRGEHGRLGFGDDKSSKMVPQQVQLLAGEDIVQVSCGGTHSVALTRDGRMFSVSINKPLKLDEFHFITSCTKSK